MEQRFDPGKLARIDECGEQIIAVSQACVFRGKVGGPLIGYLKWWPCSR